MNNINLVFQNKKGLTLIELLLVISIIGVLSGVLVSVINPTNQKNIAQDGVAKSNLEKLATSVETYYAAEGSYPATADFTNSTSLLRTTYVKVFPSGFTYAYLSSTDFRISTASLAESNRFFVYRASWGQIMNCPQAASDSSACREL